MLFGGGTQPPTPSVPPPPSSSLWPHSTALWHPMPFRSKAAALGAAPCPQPHWDPYGGSSPPPQKKGCGSISPTLSAATRDLLPKNSSKKPLF